MQYKIPQNVGIEDKIVGPLSLRQLIILAVGFGVSYVLFAILSKLYELNILEYIVIAIPGLIAAAFAMIRINDIPLIKYMFLFLEFSIKPKKRIWDHRGIASLVSPDLSGSISKATAANPNDSFAVKTQKASNLCELTRMLNSQNFEHVDAPEHLDVDQADDDDLVSSAYFGNKKDETGNMYWRTRESHMEMLKIFAQLPTTKLKKGTKEAEIARQEVEKVSREVESMKKTKWVPLDRKAPVNTPVITPAQQSIPIKTQEPVTPSSKKIRKRKRPTPQPIRENNNINTLNKKQPAQYIPNPGLSEIKSNTNLPIVSKSSKDGEFDIRDLEKGEIEINLD